MATLKNTVDVEAACHTVTRSLGYSALKPEELRVIKSFVFGKDIFAVLPTGFGKSLCYVCLPAILGTRLKRFYIARASSASDAASAIAYYNNYNYIQYIPVRI